MAVVVNLPSINDTLVFVVLIALALAVIPVSAFVTRLVSDVIATPWETTVLPCCVVVVFRFSIAVPFDTTTPLTSVSSTSRSVILLACAMISLPCWVTVDVSDSLAEAAAFAITKASAI
ncbi:hypothetical protein D3C81_1932750 [compost metagenome]